MTKTREVERDAAFWGYKSPRQKPPEEEEAVPLHYLTAAYRRKRTLTAVMDPILRQTYAGRPGKADRHDTLTSARHSHISVLYAKMLL